ncbi:NADH dehydrogenase (ubiquinone) 15 kDa subunit [Temnothorax americanus]|uniref:NADH dehydrogenase (ubiquinone) 15 kDa subunit n=1 Tax=Temnothorax americanus TaxID=1964332 RepID=UPI0040692E2C
MINHDNIVYMRYGTPLLKGPFTDLFLHIRGIQCVEECAPYEVQYVDCLEAYGYHRGKEKCRLILEDMYECVMKIKRGRRVKLMNEQRARRMFAGEKSEDVFEPTPPLDLY